MYKKGEKKSGLRNIIEPYTSRLHIYNEEKKRFSDVFYYAPLHRADVVAIVLRQRRRCCYSS